MCSERITQKLEFVESQMQKKGVLLRLLNVEDPPFIVFCNEKRECDHVAKIINDEGVRYATVIHGDKQQSQRTSALAAFKSGSYDVLVGTDVVGRGIDIPDVNTVINYDLPDANGMDKYSHRIGRTGRAGKEGCAVSIVAPEDNQILEQLKEILSVRTATVRCGAMRRVSRLV